jgi:hypothetical protein
MKARGSSYPSDSKATRIALVDDLFSRLISLNRQEWATILIAVLALVATIFIYLDRQP